MKKIFAEFDLNNVKTEKQQTRKNISDFIKKKKKYKTWSLNESLIEHFIRMSTRFALKYLYDLFDEKFHL